MSGFNFVEAIEFIEERLDATSPMESRTTAGLLCQALKVQEEAGELAAALIGATGQNPRKGVTHTLDDVAYEAIDVAVTALVLVAASKPGQLSQVVQDRLGKLVERAAGWSR